MCDNLTCGECWACEQDSNWEEEYYNWLNTLAHPEEIASQDTGPLPVYDANEFPF